jgi:hypothetical protein
MEDINADIMAGKLQGWDWWHVVNLITLEIKESGRAR